MAVPDRDTIGRRRIAALAGHLGDEPAALSALGDSEAAVRATALGALLRMGAIGPEHVTAAFDDPAPAVRARAAEVAVDLGPAMADGLTALLSDAEPSVVEAACFALGELGSEVMDDEPVTDAVALVAGQHPDPLCREAAVAALGAIGAPASLNAVLAATVDKPAVRRRAVLALAAFEGVEVEAALERALSDRDWQVRQAAEDLTGRLSDG